MDVVSLPRVYAGLHAKLIRSYAFEALLKPADRKPSLRADTRTARTFLDGLPSAKEEVFPSIG